MTISKVFSEPTMPSRISVLVVPDRFGMVMRKRVFQNPQPSILAAF